MQELKAGNFPEYFKEYYKGNTTRNLIIRKMKKQLFEILLS